MQWLKCEDQSTKTSALDFNTCAKESLDLTEYQAKMFLKNLTKWLVNTGLTACSS